MEDCFIICPLNLPGSEIRKRSDLILKYVLSPILKSKGYNAIRADHIPKAGLITTQIINLIIDSQLVIADLSGGNPNVFYELAIRHAVRKPYIQVIEEGEKIPFDVGAVRTISIDHTNLDSVETSKQELLKQIEEIEKGHVPDSPISVATNVKLIQENDDFAEAIAEKISDWSECGYCEIPGELFDGESYIRNKLDELTDKVDRLSNYGMLSMEDILKSIKN